MSKPHEWHKISGCFTATEAAQYLTIGNFFNDKQTKYIELDLRRFISYYFIDDVSVTETALTGFPELAIQDTTLCPNRSIAFSLPDNPQIRYQWQDGTASSTYKISQPGVYSVTATAGPCMVTDTFRVTQEKPLRLPADTTLCRGTTLLLNPENPTAYTLRWSDGSTGPTLQVSQDGIYWTTSESPVCLQTDSIRVNILDCPGPIPNIFTPNDDGINDTFFIKDIDLVPWKLEIYNRWGSRVYQDETYKNNWKGEGLPGGLYYYSLSSNLLNKYYKGWVQIMR